MFGICIKAGKSMPGIWRTLDIPNGDYAEAYLGEVPFQPDPGEYKEVSYTDWYNAIQEARKAA